MSTASLKSGPRENVIEAEEETKETTHSKGPRRELPQLRDELRSGSSTGLQAQLKVIRRVRSSKHNKEGSPSKHAGPAKLEIFPFFDHAIFISLNVEGKQR